jgi:two-component system, NarL family, nitrate/nitrite response regulator NarL
MRLVLCDDNRIFCEALAVALEARGHRALAIATTADESVAAVARYQPDACLLDLRFHNGGDGLGAARMIRDRYPETAVLVVSGRADKATFLAAKKIGVAGVFGKDQELDRIAAALDVIAASRSAAPRPPESGAPESGALPEHRTPPDDDLLAGLTPRETEVLRRITAGQSTRKMAAEMNVTTETLRTYVKNVLAKLGAHSRLEAAALASKLALPGEDEPAGGHPMLATLTPREREILTHLTEGSGQREVARQLHMSLKTVNTHLHNLRSKLGVHSTLEAVALARSQLSRPSAHLPGPFTAAAGSPRAVRRDLPGKSATS